MPAPTRFRAALALSPELNWIPDATLTVADSRVVSLKQGEPFEVDLGRVILAPGQVNAHSHAFQRLIRGRTEFLHPARQAEDFWSWREAMYGAALGLSLDQVEAASALAFYEMALAGITTVGEFHYLHHQPDGRPWPDPDALADRVVAAARRVGLRICLLRVAYHQAGPGRPALPEQRRFIDPTVDECLARVEALEARYADAPEITVGIAPHSVRAVPDHWLEAIAAWGADGRRPVHLHACEQRAELAQCHAAYGMGPIELLEATGLLAPHLTLVHATHLEPGDLDRLHRARPTVCACPTTERNLGDGVLRARDLLTRGVPIALGSDSHSCIDPWAEMRLVEYHERLLAERRNVLAPLSGPSDATGGEALLEVARTLWPMGTTSGGRALGLPVGALAPGQWADFVTLDPDHVTLLGDLEAAAGGARPDPLLADIVLTMPPAAVRDVYVGGQAIVQDGQHPEARQIVEAGRAARRAT